MTTSFDGIALCSRLVGVGVVVGITLCLSKMEKSSANKKRKVAPSSEGTSGESQDGTIDVYLEFETAQQRLMAARNELVAAKNNMTRVREQLRSQGAYEPDSLLYLSDGKDENILTAIFMYLTPEDVARCELTCCIAINKGMAVHNFWQHLGKKIDATCKSTDPDPRVRIVRFCLASNLARRIGSLGDLISKHLIEYVVTEAYDRSDRRLSNSCYGCDDFPEVLDFGVFHQETRDDYELFVRLSRTSDNALFAEGFCHFEQSDANVLGISLQT